MVEELMVIETLVSSKIEELVELHAIMEDWLEVSKYCTE
jgi:hypothetical protein